MKRIALLTLTALLPAIVWAAPMRVALMDFEDITGGTADARLGGTVSSEALAAKGVSLLGKALLRDGAYTLIDRRDFINQVEKLQLTDQGQPTPTQPSFLHAAQALKTDAVLRGSLQSFSTGKEVVDQGGYRTEFATASVRVSLEALDSVDGSVIAIADGVGSKKFRQTAATSTVLGEEDVISLMDDAIGKAVPELTEALNARQARLAARPKVMLSVSTDADPALVEIDGILIGSTPLTDFELYKGDHVLTVGKAGYYDITKRILFEADTSIEVPMFRFELTADEVKGVLEKARLHVFDGEPGLIINTISDQ